MLKLPRPHKVLLESGAVLLYQRNPVSSTNAFGVWIKSGSRDEMDSERGFSHFLEHLVFRGTRRRSALQIALDLEEIGGAWDAFTGKESTCYHGKVLEEQFEVLVDVFSDIISKPSIPKESLGLERKIIKEEIRSIKDSPEDLANEMFLKTVFKGHPLGNPVTGRISDISGCNRRDLVSFHKKRYTHPNTVFGYVGDLAVGSVTSILDGRFKLANGSPPTGSLGAAGNGGRIRSVVRPDLTQSHICIGSETVGASSPYRYPLLILSNAIGGGVSSRLFQSLRERTGLAYSVYSFTNFWQDTGVICFYFSVDPRNVGRAIEIFRAEMEAVRDGRLGDTEIKSAKAQAKAALIFGMENIENRLFRLFNCEFYLGGYVDPVKAIADLEKVDADQVAEASSKFLDETKLSYVTCGPAAIRRVAAGIHGPRS